MCAQNTKLRKKKILTMRKKASFGVVAPTEERALEKKKMPRKRFRLAEWKILRQLAKVQRSNDELAPPPSQRFFFSKKLYMFVGATNTLAMSIHFHSSLPSSIPVYKKVDNVSVFRCFAFLFFFRGFKRSSKYRCLVNTHVLHGCPLLCCLY